MSKNEQQDRLYRTGPSEPEPFRFDDSIARVFPDMIHRSVPGYPNILEGIGLLTRRYVQPGSRCYDLGCSLGAATLQMRHNILVPDVRLIGVDSSPAMAERCRQNLAEDSSVTPVEILAADMTQVPIEDASVIVLNFTLQFLAPELRGDFLRRLYQGLRPGGILVLSEKIRFEDATEQAFMTEIHEDFKRRNGYSDLEIARKRQALENVLVPWSESDYRNSLAAAGFSFVSRWIGWFQFVSFLARKD